MQLNRMWQFPEVTLTFPENRKELYLIAYLCVIRDDGIASLSSKTWYQPWVEK